jgi:hypothetical protein
MSSAASVHRPHTPHSHETPSRLVPKTDRKVRRGLPSANVDQIPSISPSRPVPKQDRRTMKRVPEVDEGVASPAFRLEKVKQPPVSRMKDEFNGSMLPLTLQFLAAWLAVWFRRVLQHQVDYLRAENRILKERLDDRKLQLTDVDRCRLAVQNFFSVARVRARNERTCFGLHGHGPGG